MSGFSINFDLRLDVIEHRDSYVKFLQRGNVIQYPGFGIMKSPHHPSANQSFESQDVFLGLYKKQGYIPIFYRDGPFETLMGNYKLTKIIKRVSFAGFQYYEYTFFRIPIKNKYF